MINSLLLRHFLNGGVTNKWQYIVNFIIGALLLFFIHRVHSVADTRMGGLLFYQWTGAAIYVFYTLAVFVLFSGIIVSDRRHGQLDLILLSGVGKFTYIGSRYIAAVVTSISLLLVQLPVGMYAVSYGGIHPNQIISIYLYLLCWLFLISQICLWASVTFSSLSEVYWTSGCLIGLVFIGLSKYGLSPFLQLSAFLKVGVTEVAFLDEYWYFVLSGAALFLLSGLIFIKMDTMSISLFSGLKERWRIASLVSSSGKGGFMTEQITVRFNNRPLILKDLYLNPPLDTALYSTFIAQFPKVVFVSTLLVFWFSGFLVSGVLTLFCLAVILHYNRLINCFLSELEDQTLSTLILLPMSHEELLKEKIIAGQSYTKFLKYIYFIMLIFMLIGLVFSVFDFVIFQLFMAIAGLPVLQRLLTQVAVFICLKSESPTKTNCLLAMIITTLIYVAYPLLSLPFSGYCYFYLKKKNVEILPLRAAATG